MAKKKTVASESVQKVRTVIEAEAGKTLKTAEQLDRLFDLCGVLQSYHESWLRLEDAKRQDDARQHLFQARQAGLITGGDQDAGQHERDAIHSGDMIHRLDSAIENWTPLVNEFFRLAILHRFDIMSPAFGQIEVSRRMPHRIDSFNWQAFSDELRLVRHEVLRRRTELGVNVVPSLVTLGDHPQIILDGLPAIALEYETAVWLKALIDCGDLMSGAKFNRQHPELGGNIRADRLKIPAGVKKHVDSQTGKGSRWLT